MCRETEVERHFGGTEIDTLTSVQPPPGKGVAGVGVVGVRSPKPPTNKVYSLRIASSDKEEQQRVLNEREGVRPVLPRKTTTQSSPRLLPYFPKPGVTSPPPPQSLARNPDPALRVSAYTPPSTPPSKSTARHPSPSPGSRATPSSANSVQASSPASRATARNPSPAPSSRARARNPSPSPSVRGSATNPASPPAPAASRAAARNPSPTPVPRTVARHSSPTPAPRATATARNPSPAPAVRASARNPSPAPASRSAPVASSRPQAAAATPIVNSIGPSSNGKVLSSRRSASPAVTRKDPSRPGPLENGSSKISTTPEAVRRAAGSMWSSPPNVLISSNGNGASSKSTLDMNKSLNRSLNRSFKKDGAVQCSPESHQQMFSPVKKLTPVELQAQKKERISGYGRKAGTPKSGRVACEGMLPSSPVQNDTRKRCHWVTPQSESDVISYHDEVWGVPVHDDKLLFELLVLEGAQSELSRPQILSMREYFREVFGGFDPEIVSKFDEKKVAALKLDEVIRQPEAKLRGVIDNAKQLLKIVQEFGSFDKYLWNFVGFKPIVNTPRSFTQIPVKSSKSEMLSKDLMRRGFRYVGPTTVYSFMQAAGMVNDHLVSCYRHGECCAISQMQVTVISNGNKEGC